MDLIVDTNALSSIASGDPEIGDLVAASTAMAIPVVVLGEYRFGIAQSRYRAQHQRWLDVNLPSFGVLDITAGTTLHYAEIRLELKRAGTPIPTNDLWIAALSRQHALPILSRDRHFDRVHGLRRVSW